MGLLRFLTPHRERVSETAVQRAYVTGLDDVPTPANKSWEEPNLLRLERDINESGCFHVPWEVAGHGPLLLSTASLMERERPYHLPVELARGTVNRLRSKAAIWQLAGLELPADLTACIQDIVQGFCRTATSQHQLEKAADSAEEIIGRAVATIFLLSAQYAEQVIRYRTSESSPLGTLMAGGLGNALIPEDAEPMFGAAFNTAAVPFVWKQIETDDDSYNWKMVDRQIQFCLREDLKIIGGPLLRLDRETLPARLADENVKFSQLEDSVQKYVTAVVQRYKGKVQLWHGSSGTNVFSELPLAEDERLRLTILTIETIRDTDPRTPVFVSFDQPWAEYLIDQYAELPPMHFADMLVRAELGLAGIGLEMNLGYWPGGSLPRDLLEIGQLIDQWSVLGMPMIVSLSAPGGSGDDSLAQPDGPRIYPGNDGEYASVERQKEFVNGLVQMLVAKQSIHGIVWSQVFDSLPHKFPHSGLFNANSRPKPSLSSIISIRGQHLS